jgi:hypothetical protein
LFFTIVTFRRTKRLDQITLLNNIFNELRDLDRELTKIPSEFQYNDVRSQWYTRTFNSVDWLSFMINEKMITDKKIIPHMKPVIATYYEEIFKKNTSVDQRNSKFYQSLQNFIK